MNRVEDQTTNLTVDSAETPAEFPADETFLWPPSIQLKQPPGPPDTEHQSSADPVAITLHQPNRLIESIETHLLGRTGLAFDQWALRTGWQGDLVGTYCHRCGGGVGDHEADGDGCATCRSKPLPWDRAIRLGRYDDMLRQEILALKFHAWRPTGKGLGEHLGYAIREQLEIADISPDQVALVPIPTHRLRRISRGIDHTRVLAKAASRSCGCRVHSVLSTRYRPEQVGLSMTARARNMKGAFFVSGQNRRKLNGLTTQNQRVYVLIDDVRTTGATFVAAGKSLKLALKASNEAILEMSPGESDPASIWVASISVAGESRRENVEAHR